MLDGKSQLSEHRDRTAFSALEIAGGEALARRELIRCAQDGFGRVPVFVPDQVIRRGGAEAMGSEEPLRPQLVVLLIAALAVNLGAKSLDLVPMAWVRRITAGILLALGIYTTVTALVG